MASAASGLACCSKRVTASPLRTRLRIPLQLRAVNKRSQIWNRAKHQNLAGIADSLVRYDNGFIVDVRASGMKTDGSGNVGYNALRDTRGSSNGGCLAMGGRMERRAEREGMMDSVATVGSSHQRSAPRAAPYTLAPSVAWTFKSRFVQLIQLSNCANPLSSHLEYSPLTGSTGSPLSPPCSLPMKISIRYRIS